MTRMVRREIICIAIIFIIATVYLACTIGHVLYNSLKIIL
jgi:hypothetical protein